MKQSRVIIALTVLALIVALVPATAAQEQTFGLSQEDYDLWTTANEQSSAADTLSFDFVSSFSVSEISGFEYAWDITGSGVTNTDDENPLFSLDVSGSVTTSEGEMPADVQIRLVDDMLFINRGDEGWQGASLDDLLETGAGMAGRFGFQLDPESLMEGDLSGMGAMGGMMSSAASLDPSEYVSISRDDADGWAHFTGMLDIAGLTASEEFGELVGGAAGMMGGAAGGDSPQTLQLGAMVAAALSQSSLTFEQYVNTETELVDRSVLTVNLPLDQLFGEGALVSLEFDIQLSGYGEPVTVEAPAEFEALEIND
jgi:hypothetical protein